MFKNFENKIENSRPRDNNNNVFNRLNDKEFSRLKPWSSVSKCGPYNAKHPWNNDLKVCLLCSKNVPNKSGNTKSLETHLRKEHDITSIPKSGDKPQRFNQSITSFTTNPTQVNTAESVICDFICRSMIAPHAIEKGSGFQVLSKKAFNIVPTKYWSWGKIEEVYSSMSENLKSILQQSTKVSIILDDWTSHSNHRYRNINAFMHSNEAITKYSLGLVSLGQTDCRSFTNSILVHLNKFGVQPKFFTVDGA